MDEAHEARGKCSAQALVPFFQGSTCTPRCCTTCMSRGVAREQMRVYAPNRILGGWPSPATVHSPHRCGAAATCQRQRQPSRAPQKTSPSAGPPPAAVPSIVNPNPQLHDSDTDSPRDRPSLLTHAGTIHLCFHRLSHSQSPECGSLRTVLSSLTGLSEVSMLSSLRRLLP